MNDEIARAHIVALYSQVNQYRASEDYCDVEIYVEGRAFKCHRLILAAASEYFHIMFGGNFKESTASVVTLQEVEPATFGEILQFIYTGNVTINNTNLFKLVRASEFFKISHLEELCIWYVKQNENALIENGLEMLSYVRVAGSNSFAKFLGQRIYRYFDYFSKTPEFLQMSLEDFISILDLIPVSPTMLQDTFMLAVMRWIRHTDHSPQASRRSHFQELLKRISFANLSSNCVEYLNRTNFQNDIAFEEIAKTDETRSRLYATDSALEEVVDFDCFHVYVRAYSGDCMLESSIHVFSLYKHFDEYKWYHTYQYDSEYNPNFTRTVVLDHHLYSLSVYETTLNPGIRQSFKTSSSISWFPDTLLKPPPLFMDEYDMCGLDNNIYVYDKDRFAFKRAYASSFTDEELMRGVFLYNREVDTWLPLPSPQRKLYRGCMTCDGQRLYLIGGTDLVTRDYTPGQRYVQSYDPRTSEWILLQSTPGMFEGSACCAHQSKIYVSGGFSDPTALELYDPRRERWEKVQPMEQGRNGHRMEPFIYSTHSLVAVGRVLSSYSDMEIYDTTENKWKIFTPSLHKTVMDCGLQFTDDSLEIVDVVTYKPIGL